MVIGNLLKPRLNAVAAAAPNANNRWYLEKKKLHGYASVKADPIADDMTHIKANTAPIRGFHMTSPTML
jgi:hypothetical protein